MKIDTNMPNSVMKINIIDPKQNSNRDISVSHTLASFMGVGTQLPIVSHIKELNSPSSYFIHCDLIDPTKKLFQWKEVRHFG